MATEHAWTEDDTRFSVFPDQRHPNGAPAHVVAGFAMEPYISSGALIREVLRLAQREADLLSEREERRSAIEGMERLLTEKEHQLALAKGTIENRIKELGERIIRNAQLQQRLNASEADNRAKCLELAEKAGQIRELEAESGNLARAFQDQREANGVLFADAKLGRALVDILSRYCGERGASEGAVETLERIIEERDAYQEGFRRAAGERAESDAEKNERIRVLERRLEDHPADRLTRLNALLLAAIEDGVDHVERARQILLKEVRPALTLPPLDPHAVPLSRTVEQLDLAHEVLSRTAKPQAAMPDAGPRVWRANGVDAIQRAEAPSAPWTKADLDALLERVVALESHRADMEAVVARAAATGKTSREGHNRLVGRVEQLEQEIECRLGPAAAKLIDRLEACETDAEKLSNRLDDCECHIWGKE